MSEEGVQLPAAARAVIDQEESLLGRVRASLEAARRRNVLRARDRGGDSNEALRTLRDQAARASADDLPALLHEMSVRHRLAERRPRPRFPDASSPYIAHLCVDEGEGPVDYLLGHVTFFDAAQEIRIVDWRVAPVARIFYRYREGDRFEERFPGRVVDGVVIARRIVVIQNGELARIVGDDLFLEKGRDGRWRSADRGSLSFQGGGAETAARPGILGVGVGTAQRATRADITGKADYNYELAQRRAERVAGYLVSEKGVDPLNVHVVSYGAAKPVANNKVLAGRRENRRIEILVYQEKVSANTATH